MRADAGCFLMTKTQIHREPTVTLKNQAEERDSVEYQLRQVMLGKVNSVVCPYCGGTVVMGVDKLCCKWMAEVADEVLRDTEPTDQHIV
jgi:GTP-dependent phosphoenolpyruvate carboxykinase